MRLVLVTQDFPPARGGIQTWAVEVGRRLAARCDAFAVIAPEAKGADALDASFGFPIVRTGSSNTLIAAAAPALRRLARRGFDRTLHAQWSTAPAALALRAAGRLRSVAIMLHGRELLLRPWQRAAPLQAGYDLVRRRTLSGADRLLANSRFTAELATSLAAPRERIQITHCGTDPDRFALLDAAPLRRRLELGERPVLLSITRLVRRKGLDTVLCALPAVRAAAPDVAYVIVGDGPDRERLQALALELGLGSVVRFIGEVPSDELPTFYRLADLFVMPSRSDPPDVEGFGIVFLEAAAAERAVIAARAGGVPDAVADGITGLLVAPDAPAELTRAILSLLQDPARRHELGRRGRERVLAEFTWDHVVDRTLPYV